MAMSQRERAERELSQAMIDLALTIRRQSDVAAVRARAQHQVAAAAAALVNYCDGYDRETMVHYVRLAEQEGRICERMAEVHSAEAARAEAQAQSRATKADRFHQEARSFDELPAERASGRSRKGHRSRKRAAARRR